MTKSAKEMYVYAINMEFCEVYNVIKKELWDRKKVSLGIITSERLPVDQVNIRLLIMIKGKILVK